MTSKAMLSVKVNEAAAALGKRPETVRRWLAAGIIKATYDGPHVFISTAALGPLAKRVCACCGKSYHPDRPTRPGRYCSKACIWQAAYERRKADRPNPAPAPVPKMKMDLSNRRLVTALKSIRNRSAGRDSL